MKASKLERAYQTFVTCREVVRSATNEAQLFDDICQLAVSELGFRLAWIGLISASDPVIRPVATAGYEEGYLSTAPITWSEDEDGSSLAGQAIRECRPVVAQNIATDPRFAPWRDDALERGYASSAALPLYDNDGPYCLGALSLYASEPDAFDDDELALLEEVATDLMLGIHCLRMQKALDTVAEQLDRAMAVEAAAMAASALAHDFNNLLQVVASSIEVASLARDATGRARALDDAREAVETMTALGWHVLSLTRRAANEAGWTRADQVVRRTASLLDRVARRSTLEFDLTSGRSRVPIASIDLERVLINLVVNADQAMSSGGRLSIASEIRVVDSELPTTSEPLGPGTYLALIVEDEGEGIPPDVLPHIFEPLFTTKADQGTGLGLPGVLAIVQPIGGGVIVESKVGQGTRVTVMLPARAPT